TSELPCARCVPNPHPPLAPELGEGHEVSSMAHILLRYGEIHLKGQNQRFFLDALVRNVRESIADLGHAVVRQAFGRILVDSPAEEAALIGRLRKIFGVVSLSPVQVASPALPDIAGAAVDMVGAALGVRTGIATFKVDTRRA